MILLTDNTNVYIRCKCGHTWQDTGSELKKDIVVTSATIEEIKFTVDYKCEKCGKEVSACIYVR
ncbi:MAG: hypothetical protein KAJ20_01205 [Candidatus Aenigmarchaeota archaeon]|nr:hypothetical protein [Candidatus Aenigmarchaeota archaeon]MCK5372935.1 hypothetical protein [Candidatus Aenigmarchaeota archaeon]MCK5452443.1 hypothetical protein [Candidatus Aenigmarchaeota archaeon]